MTPVSLPELPEPYGWLHDARGNDPLTFVRVMPEFLKLCTSSMPVYSHAQIQAAVLAERAAERARCAAICENNEVLNGVHGGQRIRPNSTESGKHDGTAYAAAIRNQD